MVRIGKIGKICRIGKIGGIGKIGKIGKIGQIGQIGKISLIGKIGKIHKIGKVVKIKVAIGTHPEMELRSECVPIAALRILAHTLRDYIGSVVKVSGVCGNCS